MAPAAKGFGNEAAAGFLPQEPAAEGGFFIAGATGVNEAE
jgi:hypothetical protein